jgi:hypothetical protein
VSVDEVGEGACIELGLALGPGCQQLQPARIEAAVKAGQELH